MPQRALPPLLLLCTDGAPTNNFSLGLQALMDEPWGRKSVRLGVAIGEDDDTETLHQFIGNPEIIPLQANNLEDLVRYMNWVSTTIT